MTTATATTERRPLTHRQAEVLRFIRDFVQRHGVSPSFREICRQFSFRSESSGAVSHLRALTRKGYLRQLDEGKARCFVLAVEPGHCACCGQPLPEGGQP